jgi:hypothetical protein
MRLSESTPRYSDKMEEGVRHADRKPWSLRRLATVSAFILGLLGAGETVRAAGVSAPGNADLPESMTGTADGALHFGSFAGGRNFRAASGATEAKQRIKQGANSASSAPVVLSDPTSDTLLSACSDDGRWGGVAVPSGDKATALKLFDLTTGEPNAGLPSPASKLIGQTALCNGMVVASGVTAYVADSLSGLILRLKPGSGALEAWAHDAGRDAQGAQPDGGGGAITKLKTSRPLYRSAGLRAFSSNKLMTVEGEAKSVLDPIAISGDNAQIDTVKSGFEGPVSLWRVGGAIYVLDAPLRYVLDPILKGKWPVSTTFAVKAP